MAVTTRPSVIDSIDHLNSEMNKVTASLRFLYEEDRMIAAALGDEAVAKILLAAQLRANACAKGLADLVGALSPKSIAEEDAAIEKAIEQRDRDAVASLNKP